MQIKTNWFSRGSKISGCASILGSWQICHQVCTSLIAALATFGIALQGMPLLFLNRWQWPLWIAALILFGVVLTIRVGARMRCITTRGVFGNAGLLMAGAPFAGDWVGVARTAGLTLVLVVLLWYLKDLIVKRVETGWVVDFVEQGRKVAGGMVGVVAVVVGLLTIGGDPISVVTEIGSPNIAMPQSTSRMKFTLFDVAQAKELMDKNGDGACDSCGMAVDQCIESGMMECTMDPQAKIGLLGSAHIHAQFKVFKDGKPLDLTSYGHRMHGNDDGLTSSFIHVHAPSPQSPPSRGGEEGEGDGAIRLHMHASGVPLKMWFDSVGLPASGAEITVNGQKSGSVLDYVFNDGDDIIVNISPPLTGGTPVVPPPLVGGVRGGVKSFTTPT